MPERFDAVNTMRDFVHLHLHSEYSLLKGACRISKLPAAVLSRGQKAVAVTDLGVMYGCADFSDACVRAGVKPIIGCELAVDFDGVSGSVVLLVTDAAGYGNLTRLVTLSCISGKNVPQDELFSHSGGLICLSGGKRGPLNILSDRDDREGARALAGKQGLEGQGYSNEFLISVSRSAGIPPVACNDVFYIEKADAGTRETLSCIGDGRTVSEGREPGFETDEFYLRSSEEMENLFGHIPEALDNSVRIAEKCSFELKPGKTVLPEYSVPDGETPDMYLRRMAFSGYEKAVSEGRIVFSEGRSDDDYRARTEYELLVISGMGYSSYFLIVADFVGYAKSTGVPTGPGRGSGAGSLVAFLIGITEVDPVRYGLLFEAFLNRERISMPDFDIDFGDRRRDEVIKYVTAKYGADHVAQIITFGTLASRAAIRDAGRVLRMPQDKVERALSVLPESKGKVTGELSAAMSDDRVRKLCDADPDVKLLYETAADIEGYPRNASTHAAGVVITPKPLTEYVPLADNGGVTVTQYGMDAIARLGLLKFDFLALRYLTVMDDAVSAIRESEPGFSLADVPTDDKKTFALIGRGMTAGVFQLENQGMRRLLMNMKPRSLSDIMVAIALYRPGPMDSIPKYLENRAKNGDYGYRIAGLKEILDETCGCIVYQEQVMGIFRRVAGYSYGRADVVRRAIAKKKPGVIEAEKAGFIAGAEARGIDRAAAEALYGEMADFADYAFKKSHSAAYGIISYRTAYLKANYPGQYVSALMNSVSGDFPKIAAYAADLEKFGISIGRPDVNLSGECFSVSPDGKTVRFGLSSLKGIGERLASRICEERKNGNYVSFENFVRRNASAELGEKQLETLVSAGCFDSLGRNRNVLLDALHDVCEKYKRHQGTENQAQIGFFDDEADAPFDGYRQIPGPDPGEAARRERELCGMSFSDREVKKTAGIAAPAREETHAPRRLFIRTADGRGEQYRRAAALCRIFEGKTPVWLYDSESAEYRNICSSEPTPRLLSELKSLLGDENVVLK